MPHGNSISIVPLDWDAAPLLGATRTGTIAAAPAAARWPRRYCRRQLNSRFAFTAWRSATSVTEAPVSVSPPRLPLQCLRPPTPPLRFSLNDINDRVHLPLRGHSLKLIGPRDEPASPLSSTLGGRHRTLTLRDGLGRLQGRPVPQEVKPSCMELIAVVAAPLRHQPRAPAASCLPLVTV